MLPTISIITPSFNQGDFLPVTIDSVLTQGYPNLEYIVMDGGSTDNSVDILKRYNNRISWSSGPDSGQSNAINNGWLRAKGDILAWINSDDFFYPNALNNVGKFFQDHPGIDWVYGDCDFVDSRGSVIKPYPSNDFDYPRLIRETHNYIPQPATFIRRAVFEHCGVLDENLSYVMDMEYWMRIGSHHPGRYLPIRLAALRLHSSAKSIEHLGDFARELVMVYERFFAKPNLPDGIKNLEKAAMHNVFTRAADCSFWSGHLRDALQYAAASARYSIFTPKKIWIWIALGPLGYAIAKRYRTNPYYPPEPRK